MYTEFNKANLKKFRNDVNDRLSKLGDEIGVKFEVGKISYPLLVRKPNGKVYKYRYETPKKYYDSLEGNLTLTDKQGNKI